MKDSIVIEHGRVMTTEKGYSLPVDERERDRLSLQHRMWILMLGGTGLYPPDVDELVNNLLRPPQNSQRQPAILDVGSGSGIWAVEMAELHPNSLVVGFDLVQSRPSHVPSNCSFVSGDAMKDLNQYTCQFDIVHCRSVRGHVANSKILMNGLKQALRPGGLLLLADGIFRIVDENLDTLLPQPITSLSDPVPLQPADKLHSWLLRWQYEVFIRFSQRVDPYESNVLQSMLDSIKETGGFMNENLKHRVYHSPVGWPGKESLGYENAKELGEVMATNTLEWVRASHVPLLRDGIPQNLVESWRNNVIAEIKDPEKKMHVSWAFAWAIRNEL